MHRLPFRFALPLLLTLTTAACPASGPTPRQDAAVETELPGEGDADADADDADAPGDSADVAADSAVPPDAAAPTPACVGSYDEPVAVGALDTDALAEVSGLVASRTQPELLWAHNDSGAGPVLYALSTAGALRARVTVTGARAQSVDWEDLAAAHCPTGTGACLWVADMGDNLLRRADLAILVVVEPRVSAPAGAPQELEAPLGWRFPVAWPGAPQDSEALWVAPDGGSLWLVTKADDATAGVFRHPGPFVDGQAAVLEHVVDVPSPGVPVAKGRMVTGADLHPNGQRVLLRTYTGIFEYRLPAAGDLAALALIEPLVVAWGPLTEPQGEAVAYDAAGTGVFSLSEDPKGRGRQPLHHAACLP